MHDNIDDVKNNKSHNLAKAIEAINKSYDLFNSVSSNEHYTQLQNSFINAIASLVDYQKTNS
jgi:ubiquinone/menaquinone biosynthesis C-methylase UbiE